MSLAGWFLVLFLMATSFSCNKQEVSPANSEPKDPVIAIVNGQEVRRSDFEAFVRLKEIEPQDELVPVPERELLRDFLVDQLLLQAARDSSVQISDEELQEYFASTGQVIDTDTHDAEQFRDLLQVQKYVRQQMAITPAIGIEQMELYYRDHKGEFVVDDRIHVLEILVPDEQQASQLASKLRSRDFRTFRRLARQHSKGLTAAGGGDLGTFERGELPEEFEKVIFALKPGQVSPVFRSEHGYHIFMVEEFVPRHAQAFQEVQGKIYEKMLAQEERAALEKYQAELFRTASIEILDPNLR